MEKGYRYMCKKCGHIQDREEPMNTYTCPQCGNTTFNMFEVKKDIDSIPTVECPYCHSINTKKISGVTKGLTAIFWGAASAGKISKQWHCNNCGSDF